MSKCCFGFQFYSQQKQQQQQQQSLLSRPTECWQNKFPTVVCLRFNLHVREGIGLEAERHQHSRLNLPTVLIISCGSRNH